MFYSAFVPERNWGVPPHPSTENQCAQKSLAEWGVSPSSLAEKIREPVLYYFVHKGRRGGLRLIDNSPFAIKVVCKGVRGMEGTKGHFVESGEAVVNKLRPKL